MLFDVPSSEAEDDREKPAETLLVSVTFCAFVRAMCQPYGASTTDHPYLS